MDDYKEKHPQTNTEEDVYFDFKLIYTSGFSNPEYSEYMEYYFHTQEAISGDDSKEDNDLKISYARYFDVVIMSGNEEIEPDETVVGYRSKEKETDSNRCCRHICYRK